MFPLFLDLTNRLAVVVGAGAVGRRKIAAVRAAGALLRVVCLEAPPPEEADVEWLQGPYRPEHLAGAALVFAAGPPALNARVVADARERGLWANSASDPERGDFHVPATVRRGALVVAVSTGGASPALAAAVRARLEEQFDDAFGAWVELLAELRPMVLARLADAEERRRAFERLAEWGWLERLRREGKDSVREAMRAEIESGAPDQRIPRTSRG